MRLSDLQNKDVVDMENGNRLGNVIDAEISCDTGNILKLIIYDKKGIFNVLKREELSIKWHQIKKIGSDVILIDKNM